MGQGLRFDILGPLRVTAANREIAVTAGRERALLAVLVLSANRVVPVTDLVDGLWTARVPRNARGQLHGCVSRLRRRLAAAHAPDLITTEAAGYRLRAGPGTVDLLEFRAHVTAARASERGGRLQEARTAYRSALELWRGPALADLDQDMLQQAAVGLEEERTRALEERIDLELALGAGGELVSELTELTARYPYRESLHGALMLALYRADRQADALAAYRRARATLVADLGQEPGSRLRELHQRILAGDRTLRPPQPAYPGGSRSSRHHCLPRTIGDFTGRKAELAWLVDAASHADPYAPLVLTLDGMPGVGKTSLAVHAAHLLAPRYPDGQLFLDLHGHSEHRPVEPAAALEALLGQLGIHATHISTGLDERIARWRAELASRRVLVVLDNAASSAQVAPLLPSGPGCLALVTSRQRLLNLDAARPRSMETLTSDEAVRLLERIVGQRVRDDPAAAAAVAERCGYLPLALRLAGARLAHRGGWRVQDLADRLFDSGTVLAELTAGDRTVADTFALSYAHLTPVSQRVFRLLGLHSGEHFDACVAAALAGIPIDETQRRLEELVDAHLVQEPLANHYQFHDLVRDYAATLVQCDEPSLGRAAAVAGLLDYYLHAATSACEVFETDNSRRDLCRSEAMRPDLVAVASRFEVDWLEAERGNVTAVVQYAAANGHHRYAWQIARAVSRFLYVRGYLGDLVTTHRLGLAATEHLGDTQAAAAMHNYLAAAFYRAGDNGTSLAHARQALALREQTGDKVGAAMARRNAAFVYAEAGYHRQAAEEYERALAAARISGNHTFLASTVANAGDVYVTLGRYTLAARYSRLGLMLAREIRDTELSALTLGNLGVARARLGQPEAALRLLRCALIFRRRTNERHGEAETLNELGVTYRMLGDFQTAVAHHQEALVIARTAGFRRGKCAAHNELGRTWYAAGNWVRAEEMHRQALADAIKIQHKYHEARARDGIAACLRDTDPEAARRLWQRALHLYRELDVPERHDVEGHLARLS